MVLGTCIGAACCACSCFSSLYGCMKCGTSSTRARVNYFTIWVVCAIVAWILRDHGYEGLKRVGGMKECANSVCTGHGMVLRITLAMVWLSSLIGLLTLGVKSATNPRAMIQNEFFPVKWLILGALVVSTIYMDNDTIVEYAHAAAFFAAIFLVAGIVLILEAAHSWNDAWVDYYDAGSKFWKYMIVFTAFGMYGLSITIWALLIEYFGGDNCTEANTFISLTIILSVFVTGVSMLNKVENGAILVSGVMVLYATYLCTSACIDIPVDNNSTCENRHRRVSESGQEAIYSIGVIFTIFAIGYATIRRASAGNSLGGATINNTKDVSNTVTEEDKQVRMESVQDEEHACEYNYTFFHIVYAGGAMYLAMVLINWDFGLPEDDGVVGSISSWTSVWIKIGSQWTAFAIYFWSLIAPIVCSDRDFS